MAKIEFDYDIDAEGTEKQGGTFALLPKMNALMEATAAELKKTKDNLGYEVALTFDVIEPEEFKGRKMWAYWTIHHPQGFDHKAYSFGKPRFDKLCRAVGLTTKPEDTDDVLFKQFVVEIGVSKGQANPTGGFYKDKNEFQHWYYTDQDAPEPVPEIGVIESTPRPANDNRPAANTNTRTTASAPAKTDQLPGETPWAAAKRRKAEAAAA